MAVVIANMVGTGVFTSLGFQVLDIKSIFALLMLWAVGGTIALSGALSYGELGAALPRSGGEYHFMGHEVSKFSERQRAMLRKSNIGFVFQSFNLIDELTVFENVELPLLYLGTPTNERRKRVHEVLERMNIMHREKHFPQQLSGGQQQRVAVARAIIADPKIILADEPTGNLDSSHGNEVMKMLLDLNEAGSTIIMVTHSPTYADYGTRVMNLFDGEILTENYLEKFHV